MLVSWPARFRRVQQYSHGRVDPRPPPKGRHEISPRNCSVSALILVIIDPCLPPSLTLASGPNSGAVPARPASQASKRALIDRLLTAKEKSKKTFTQIGKEIDCTNFYTAALFHNQQQLKPETAGALLKAVPALAEDAGLLEEMQKAPSRRSEAYCVVMDGRMAEFHNLQ